MPSSQIMEVFIYLFILETLHKINLSCLQISLVLLYTMSAIFLGHGAAINKNNDCCKEHNKTQISVQSIIWDFLSLCELRYVMHQISSKLHTHIENKAVLIWNSYFSPLLIIFNRIINFNSFPNSGWRFLLLLK